MVCAPKTGRQKALNDQKEQLAFYINRKKPIFIRKSIYGTRRNFITHAEITAR